MAMAIREAHTNPDLLWKALQRRISVNRDIAQGVKTQEIREADEQAPLKMVKVTVSLNEQLIEELSHLANLTQMTNEQTLRLAMEAYVYRL
jgi:hypothetical protein